MNVPSELAAMLPPNYRSALQTVPGQAEELRLRLGKRPAVLCGGVQTDLPLPAVTEEDIGGFVRAAAGNSCYAVQEQLRHGFLTLPGGHRLGLCGCAAVRDGEVMSLREISSLDLRFSRDITPETVPSVRTSTLIIGPPGCGKTTLLRCCIRQISDGGARVSVCDERGEIAGYHAGRMRYDLGAQTDVMTGMPKAAAMPMLLRSMNPQWIAVDEITAAEDVQAMERCSYCGVKLLATAHAESRDELAKRPVYQKLMTLGIFGRIICMAADKTFTEDVMEC